MLAHDFRSMASPIHLQLNATPDVANELFASAQRVFERYNIECSRFIAGNALARINENPSEWHEVPATLLDCVRVAYEAYLETRGAFDPRVLADIVRLGYTESIERSTYDVNGALDRPNSAGALAVWHPQFSDTAVHLDGWPVDLGGIAKGAAVARVADAWHGVVETGMVNAGGDIAAIGAGPDATGWRIGVEDPRDRDGEPVAVIDVVDQAVATSSVAIHHWMTDGTHVHHLIDPATGRPARGGILAVTVVSHTATDAEVWSKALFVAGVDDIGTLAHEKNLAALWVTEEGEVALSSAAEPLTIWKANQ
jgi:FAD:protein FMN transferase